MPIEDGVLVVGGGVAGCAAALAAARAGADVRVVSRAESTLAQASGLVDVLGYTPAGTGPVVDPFDAVTDLPEDHPYRRAGADALRDGLDVFDAATGDAYRGDHTDRNALVVTHGGAVKPTARYPASVAPGLASDARDALLVGFEAAPGHDAPLAAANLADAGVPFDVRGVTVRFPGSFRDDAAATRYATALDRDDPVEAGDGGVERSTRAALAERVRPQVGDAERVGVPALLGRDRTAEVRVALSDRLGVPVFEVPTGPPSVPGRRLEDLLYGALRDAGVRVTAGVPVVDYEAAGDRVASVTVERNGRRIDHDVAGVVLATGGLVGGGVETGAGSVREPVFDCHVPHPGDRTDWYDDAPFGDHAFARFGVAVDREMRPLDADGDPEFRNLRAAGAVVGGTDFATEKSGAGVSLATGYAAGSTAGEHA